MDKALLKKQILFYGPVGGAKGTIIGGGESGNKKTIALLKKLGFEVKIIEKPYPVKTLKILKALLYPLQFLWAYIKAIKELVFNKQIHVFHLSGFYNHLIYIEWLFITTCKWFKIPAVYEIRAGGAIESYNEGSKFYRYFFKRTLQNAKFVLCQGREYIPFIKQMASMEGLYYPNFILDDLLNAYQDNNRLAGKNVDLVYFGRISPTKNIEFIIEICKRMSMPNFTLDIIGSGSQDYLHKLEALIEESNLTAKVFIKPALNSKELNEKLKSKHFFIFPSQEKREGHSNSLTEAMSCGVVPIASTAGFNESIIGCNELVMQEFNATDYVAAINAVWQSGEWGKYSLYSYKVVADNFTENAVLPVLKFVNYNEADSRL